MSVYLCVCGGPGQFAETEVDPQALEYNSEEKFNRPLFNKLGDLGLLGITAPSEHGGSDMDVRCCSVLRLCVLSLSGL